MRKFFKRLLITLLLLSAVGIVIIIAFNVWIHNAYADRLYASIDDLPLEDQPREGSRRVAIVLGAGLTRSGEPTAVLYDRVAIAAELYQRGLVTKLLLSGDNRFVDYNEPEAMRRTAVKLGVPDDDLVLDYAGRRTYDSCYRAREIFGVNRAILVTQAFHLERAVYLCDAFGIDSLGVMADRRNYAGGAQTMWLVREAIATVGAWIDVNITRPTPVLGDKIPIEN